MSEDTQKNTWLELATEAYSQAVTYRDNNYSKLWENNIRLFQSKHESGSKYYKESYKFRSKIFRPKPRSAVRSNEAAASAAFFSNQDVVSIEPQNPDDPVQVMSAKMRKELLNYRLTETLPWFRILIGAFQEAQVAGIISSIQDWEYKTKTVTSVVPSLDEVGNQKTNEKGELLYERKTTKVVTKDQPRIRLFPPEQILFSPSADWLDPINSSPYLVLLIPMYVIDIKAKMEDIDQKTGEPKWKKLSDGELKTAIKQVNNSTRQVRSGQKEDPQTKEGTEALGNYDIVWVHQNFVRKDGDEYVYFTLGTQHMLTDPKPMSEMYHHCKNGERPVVMGVSVIEAFKAVPDSYVRLGAPIVKEANEIASSRMDNVKLVLNKRWFARRGAQVDLKSLVRNAAGSVTLMNDPNADVRGIDFNDVTGSSYAEQDRLNVDFDELMGNFSTGSVATNRKLNETVGGMRMLRGASGALTEYLIKTFAETWVEKVLRQLDALEQAYESDMNVLSIAMRKAQAPGDVAKTAMALLEQPVLVKINVGMGATDPIAKVDRLIMAIERLSNIAKAPPPGLKFDEVAKEVFGSLGYKDGERFLSQVNQQDPEKAQMAQVIQALQAEVQRLTAELENKQADRAAKILETRLKETGSTQRNRANIAKDLLLKEIETTRAINARRFNNVLEGRAG